MTYEEKRQIADFFSPSELVELLDIDTYDLVCAIEEFNEYTIGDEELSDLREIMGVNQNG